MRPAATTPASRQHPTSLTIVARVGRPSDMAVAY
jgi:hypothetical protein